MYTITICRKTTHRTFLRILINLTCVCSPLLFTLVSFSQGAKERFQFLDAEGNTVAQEKKASFFTRKSRISDTCWQFQNYKMNGAMLYSTQYKDKQGKVAHGRSSFMRPDGTLDSTGHFVNGKTHGNWRYFDSEGTLIAIKQFSMGELLSTSKSDENSGEKEAVWDLPEVEACFPDSSRGWMRYLIRNLRYPEYAMAKKINGNAEVYFVIDEDGLVRDEIVLKSVEYTIDTEALRIVRESPKWIPAVKNGKKVKSYQRQGIVFRTE